MKKKYPIPEEIKNIFTRSESLIDLRDEILESKTLFKYWKFKRIKEISFEAQKLKNEFWSKVRYLYPELDEYQLRFKLGDNYISPTIENKNE